MKRKIWIYIAVLVLLLAAASTWRLRPSMPEGSEFYQRYCDMPGVRVGFVKDFPLNDSVTCDVTTFEALNDEGWALMVEALDLKPQMRICEVSDSIDAAEGRPLDDHEGLLSFWMTGRFHPEQSGRNLPENIGDTNDTYMSSFYYHWVSVYHCVNDEQIDAIIDAHIDRLDNKELGKPLAF